MKFKSVLVTTLLFAGIATAANAQRDAAYLGGKIGMNIATMTNSDDMDARIGLNVGLFGQYFVTNTFALQGEINYSQQGVKDSDDGTTGTVKLDYLNIPILAKFYPMVKGFNVYAGPQFGFAVNKEIKASGGGASISVDLDDYVKTFDFGIALGLGYDFDFGLTLDGRWTPGLTGVFKSEYLDGFDNSKNSVFTISVGYKF
ncbi:MAG: porin family protein [Bacteroidales bacterium]